MESDQVLELQNKTLKVAAYGCAVIAYAGAANVCLEMSPITWAWQALESVNNWVGSLDDSIVEEDNKHGTVGTQQVDQILDQCR